MAAKIWLLTWISATTGNSSDVLGLHADSCAHAGSVASAAASHGILLLRLGVDVLNRLLPASRDVLDTLSTSAQVLSLLWLLLNVLRLGLDVLRLLLNVLRLLLLSVLLLLLLTRIDDVLGRRGDSRVGLDVSDLRLLSSSSRGVRYRPLLVSSLNDVRWLLTDDVASALGGDVGHPATLRGDGPAGLFGSVLTIEAISICKRRTATENPWTTVTAEISSTSGEGLGIEVARKVAVEVLKIDVNDLTQGGR